MGPNKKKKAPAAQKLIDSLLDERTSAPDPDSAAGDDLSPLDKAHSQTRSLSIVKDPDTTQTALINTSEFVDIQANPEDLKSNLELERSVSKTPFLTELERGGNHQVPHSGDAETSEDTVTPALHSFSHSDSRSVNADETQPRAKVEADQTLRINSGRNSLPKNEAQQKQAAPAVARSERTTIDSGPGMTRLDVTMAEKSEIDRHGLTDLKTAVKRSSEAKVATQKPSIAQIPFSSPEAALRQSESLRIAQNRITELENELDRLRRENEKLAMAGETLSRRSDELVSKLESLEISRKETDQTHEEEKKVFRGQLQAKDREIADFKNRLQDLEARLEGNFKKIRVRERELEHRLEIVRLESASLVSTKDKMILDLKRQIDQLTQENDYGKQKTQELYNQYKGKQETVRRVVRALRIALTILEGDEDSGNKKSE